MELVLRKRSTGDTLRLQSAKVLCHHSRKLIFLAPYAGQWVFYALAAPAEAQLLYNHLPAPPRFPLAAGDLLNLNGQDWIVESVVFGPATDPPSETGSPPICEVETASGQRFRVSHDLLLGLDLPPLTALLTFAVGRWHLHDLNGSSLSCNGKSTGRSLVLNDGDSVRIADTHLLFHIEEPSGLEREASGDALAPREKNTRGANAAPLAPSSPEIDPIYARAKALFEELLPLLRGPGRAFQPRQASRGGIRGWLRIFRRPRTPLEALDRLHFLLSASPRDRVWLIELARFFHLHSYPGLCLRMLKELCRLYPRDVSVRQTLAMFYYQQGRNPSLPAQGRLNAFEHAGRCTQFARRLAPNDPLLMDLERAIRMDQTILTFHLDNGQRAEAPPRQRTGAI